MDAYERSSRQHPHLLKAIEVDILKDGSLDLSDEVLGELDVVVGSKAKSIVVTGTLETLTRDETKDVIEAAGGRATGSVSGETDFLVAGGNPGTTKTGAAKDHGTRTIDEDEFRKLPGL